MMMLSGFLLVSKRATFKAALFVFLRGIYTHEKTGKIRVNMYCITKKNVLSLYKKIVY